MDHHANGIPEVFELSAGQSHRSRFGGDRDIEVRLICVDVKTEDYYRGGTWYPVFLEAGVTVEVDGERVVLRCGPYELPVCVNGLNIMADLVRAVAGGLDTVPLERDVRLSARSAALPWYEEDRFVFPVAGYRWRASNYQHTWNGYVHIAHSKVYYHRGEDYGAVPDCHDFLAMHGARVVKLPPPGGDGNSNEIVLSDDTLYYQYYHDNITSLRTDIAPGDTLEQGEKIGRTGNTWAGRANNDDPHLHVGMEDRDHVRLNTYPMIVQAYARTYPEPILPVAGGFRFCREGETLRLDASQTVALQGSVARYTWEFCDGTVMNGCSVYKQYPAAGTYTEKLTVRDEAGGDYLDFVIVTVSKQGYEPSQGIINYYPVRGIRAGEPVQFLVYGDNMAGPRLDFGDGSNPQREFIAKGPAEAGRSTICCEHAYAQAGIYTVTLLGATGQGLPAVYRTCVVVE